MWYTGLIRSAEDQVLIWWAFSYQHVWHSNTVTEDTGSTHKLCIEETHADTALMCLTGTQNTL